MTYLSKPQVGQPRWRDTSGVTLVEILIVMGLVGILAGVAIPTYMKDRPGADVRDAATELSHALQTARYRAVSMKRPVYFEFEPGGEQNFYTAYVDLDGDPSTSQTPTDSAVLATNIPFGDEASGTMGTRLPQGVEFGLGGATSSPDEDADTPTDPLDLPSNPILFMPRGVVSWPDTTGMPSGGIYLRHAENGSFVNSMLIHPTGLVRSYTLTGGSWR